MDIWDGGTHGAVFWGLMHSQLSLTLALVAHAVRLDLLDRISGPRLVGCALADGAVCARAPDRRVRPGGLAGIAGAGGGVPGDRAASGACWTTGALALGLALSAVLVLPAVRGLAEHGFSAAFSGHDYRAAGAALVQGAQPSSTFGFAIGLGLIAVAAAATGRQVYAAGGRRSLRCCCSPTC